MTCAFMPCLLCLSSPLLHPYAVRGAIANAALTAAASSL
jgi:hypothetical protein